MTQDKIEQELEKELGFKILKDCPDAETTDYYLLQEGETDPDREATQFEVTLWQSLLASRREVEEHDKHGILLRQDVRLLKQQRENVAKLLEDAITEAATLERENAELKEANDRLIGTIRSLTETIEAHADFAVADEEREARHREEVERLTEEFADVRNQAEDADIQLACIADQLGIKGSIKDWLQSIGGAIRELKAEVERLSTPRIIGGQEMENILELKAEVDRFIDERKGYYAVCQKYREQIEGLESRLSEAEKAIRETIGEMHVVGFERLVNSFDGIKADTTVWNVCFPAETFKAKSIKELRLELASIVLTCKGEHTTQVNLDTIDESGGQKGDEG